MKEKSINLELIYVYIRDYKVFKNQGFCFCPEYDISCNKTGKTDRLSLTIVKKENFINLFKDYNINLTVVCGKNGCGKSTLLEALQKNDENIVCLYKDKNGKFYATEEITIKLNGKTQHIDGASVTKNDSEAGNQLAVTMSDDDFNLRNLVEHYVEKPELFDGVLDESDKLFSNFKVGVWNFEDLISEIRADDEAELLNNVSDSEFEDNFFACYVLENKDVRDDLFNAYENEKRDGVGRTFFEFFKDYADVCDSKKYLDACSLEEVIFEKEYSINNLRDAEEDIKKLQQFCKEIFEKEHIGFASQSSLSSYLYYDGYFEFKNGERHIKDLSSGELQEIKYRHQLFNVLKNQNACVCCIDEPEAHLHPEWCRRFVYDFLKSFQAAKKILKNDVSFADKKITFVISTHSPFILSDITNDNIIYLERQADGATKQVEKEKSVFAGNIGELFTENFFMNETIGEFASQKIRDIIKIIKSEEEVSADKFAECERLIELVGDDLLRKLLWDMWKRRHEENQTER